MKRTTLKMIFTVAVFVTAILNVQAQIGKGSIMLGGSIRGRIGLEETTKVTGAADIKKPSYFDWNLSPTAGYFINDGLAVGLNLNVGSSYLYSQTSVDGTTSENIMSSNYGFGIFARKYKSIGTNVFLHGDLGIGYSLQSYTLKTADGQDKLKDGEKFSTSNLRVSLSPGITYFITPKWGIDLSLNNIISYNMYNQKREIPAAGPALATTTEASGGNLSFGAGLNPSLGLFYYFGK